MKKLVFYLGLMAVLAYLITFRVEPTYGFLMGEGYQMLVFLTLALGFVLIARPARGTRYLFALVLAPLALTPIFRCYFHIPYIFCHVCPRRCVWGYLRPVTIPAVLGMNLYNRSFCANHCPVGSLQDEQAKGYPDRKRSLPGFLSPGKYLVLLLVIASYFLILASRRDPAGGGLYDLMFKSSYSLPVWSLAAAVMVLGLSFTYPRLWCRNLCPVGITSDIVLKLENEILGRL